MIYKSFSPGRSLSEFIRNYTIIHFQFPHTTQVPFKQRSPKAEQKIIFYINGSPKIHTPSTGNVQTPPPVSIFSHQVDKRSIELTTEFYAFIIFLKPGVLYRLIRLPMMELLNEYCDAELFLGTEVRVISNQLAAAKSHPEMISAVEQFLLRRFRQAQTKSPIDEIASCLTADPTFFSLDAISRQACLSSKQFYRKFTERIGISPKLFSRLSRFNLAYQYKITHPGIPWSSVAQELRYTDYHHMEKEFKVFTSLTPREWVMTHLSAPERILGLR